MQDYEPIHHKVWEKLDNLAYQNYQLKKANTALKNELDHERRKNEKLRKQINPDKQHYRNARKKGRTFNG